MMSELTTEQRATKAYNSVIAHGLSLKNKLDIVFDDFQEFIKNRLGEEGYEAIVKIINPVTRNDIEKIAYTYYRFFSFHNLELFVNNIICKLDVSLEPKIKELIKRLEANF